MKYEITNLGIYSFKKNDGKITVCLITCQIYVKGSQDPNLQGKVVEKDGGKRHNRAYKGDNEETRRE